MTLDDIWNVPDGPQLPDAQVLRNPRRPVPQILKADRLFERADARRYPPTQVQHETSVNIQRQPRRTE